MINWFEGTIWYFVFLFSTIFHEASHAFVSHKLGDQTAYEEGQVTLDPRPHIRREPFGMVVVPIFSYIMGGWRIGWASAPYDILWAINYPRRAALMSLAGPLSNLVLAVGAGLMIRILVTAGIFYAPDYINFSHIVFAYQEGFFSNLAFLLSVIFSLNILLFVFNLLPFPPLDGSGVIPLFLSDQHISQYQEFVHQPASAFLGLFLAWNLIDFIFDPIHSFGVNSVYFGMVHY